MGFLDPSPYLPHPSSHHDLAGRHGRCTSPPTKRGALHKQSSGRHGVGCNFVMACRDTDTLRPPPILPPPPPSSLHPHAHPTCSLPLLPLPLLHLSCRSTGESLDSIAREDSSDSLAGSEQRQPPGEGGQASAGDGASEENRESTEEETKERE